jgi:hypothetical protein
MKKGIRGMTEELGTGNAELGTTKTGSQEKHKNGYRRLTSFKVRSLPAFQYMTSIPHSEFPLPLSEFLLSSLCLRAFVVNFVFALVLFASLRLCG